MKNLALRNELADHFGSLFDGGILEIRRADNVVLVTFDLGDTAFEAAVDGVIEAHADTLGPEDAAATGTADYAVLISSGAGTYNVSDLTVGTTPAFNVQISSTSISSGQPIDLISMEWEEAAEVTV